MDHSNERQQKITNFLRKKTNGISAQEISKRLGLNFSTTRSDCAIMAAKGQLKAIETNKSKEPKMKRLLYFLP